MNPTHGRILPTNRYPINQGITTSNGVTYSYPSAVRLQQQNMNAMRGIHPQNGVYPTMGATAEGPMNGVSYGGDYYQRNVPTPTPAGNAYLQQQQLNTQYQAKKQASMQPFQPVTSTGVVVSTMRSSLSPMGQYMQRPATQKPVYDIYHTAPATAPYTPQLQQVEPAPLPTQEPKFSPLPDSISPLESKRHHSEREFSKLYTTPDFLVKEILSFTDKPKVGTIIESYLKEHEILVSSYHSLCEIAVN